MSSRAQRVLRRLAAGLIFLVPLFAPTASKAANPVGTAFTYQGQLDANGQPFTGTCQVQLSLYDALSGGNPVGGTVSLSGVSVSNGLFSVQPDFGMNPFTGQALYVQTAVECGTDTSFTTLSPRQTLTATPYALTAASVSAVVGTSNGGTGLNSAGSAGSYLRSNGTSWTSSPLQASDLPSGSSNYIQNGTGQQANASFNVAGSGAVGGTLTASGGVQYADGSVQTTAYTPQQIALLRWYPAIQTGASFSVGNPGNRPQGIAFDGANVWIANSSDNTVTKLRASDGAVLGTFNVGISPESVAFDGANVWVVNGGSINVTELRASDGAFEATEPVGNGPSGIAFDGTNVWVANNVDGTVTKLLANPPYTSTTYNVGANPDAIAFDGANIWVTIVGSNKVTKLRASDGVILNTYNVGSGPQGIAFDGANVWVANYASNNVTKLRASDGALLGTYTVGANPQGMAFDGTNMWVANAGGGTVTKLRASDGTVLGTFKVGNNPWEVAFDGANVWVTNYGSGTVSKL